MLVRRQEVGQDEDVGRQACVFAVPHVVAVQGRHHRHLIAPFHPILQEIEIETVRSPERHPRNQQQHSRARLLQTIRQWQLGRDGCVRFAHRQAQHRDPLTIQTRVTLPQSAAHLLNTLICQGAPAV